MTSGWSDQLAGPDAERARRAAREVGARLTDPELLDARLEAGRDALAAVGAQPRGWSKPGLSGSACGVALLCAQLDRAEPGTGWDRRGHAALSTAAAAAARDETPLGLYEGLAGLGFTAGRLAAGRPRYAALLTSVDEVLTGAVGARCAELSRADGLPVHDWDLISGITGIGAHLLARRKEPAAQAALAAVLAALIDLADDDGRGPRWRTPAEHVYGSLRGSNPAGHVNCGLAHGVPGALALMSLCLLAGVELPGQAEALRRGTAWLAAQARPGRDGPQWPAVVPLGGGDSAETPPARPGWCYGNAGVARSLWLSARALGDEATARLALDSLREALERQARERPLDAPTLCHGTAGLAQVALRTAAESGEHDLAAGARELCLELVERFDADAPFGYRDITTGWREPRVRVDDPTLLAGAAGTALVLLASATDHDPGWDRALLLS